MNVSRVHQCWWVEGKDDTVENADDTICSLKSIKYQHLGQFQIN